MEGPSLVILKEELQPFLGQKILQVRGNTKQPKESLKGRTLRRIDTWAKVLFLTFADAKKSDIVTKTHFLMFGSYRINDPKEETDPRLELKFENGLVSFYSCSIQFGAEDYLKNVDRQVDVMSPDWNKAHVLSLMKKNKNTYLCDLFLDQNIFAGSGNIVKNEVLFNLRRHPLTKLSAVPESDWPKLAGAVHDYCQDFYIWKKNYELRRHWQVYRNNVCPVCTTKLTKEKDGKRERKSFFCPHCQKKPLSAQKIKVHAVLPPKVPAIKEPRIDH